MQDLKLIVRFSFDGKNELEKIIDEVAKKHNLEVKSNLGQVKVDVDSIGKGFTNITNKITTAVTKFGFFAQGVTQAVNMTKRLIDETVNLGREQIRAEKLVAGAIQATGGAAGFTATQLNRMASELQALTNIGDEETLAKVTSPLLTFKQVQGEVFAEAQMAILDMAEALNQDLQQAAIQVGKALNDPILGVTTLRRVGVQLTEQQEEQVKGFMAVNKVAEAQKIILKELNSQFGGQAKNVADPLIQLQNTWGDIKEIIGIAIIPGLNAIATSTKNWLEALQPATSELEKVTKESTNQQAEFFSLTSAYETLRFKQGETLESSTALKDIIDTLNSKYGDYLGNIDLATTKYQDFKTAVSNATDELIREAMVKQVAAERTDLANEIAENQIKQREALLDQQETIQKRQEDLNHADENLQEKYLAYKNSSYPSAYEHAVAAAATNYENAEKRLKSAEAKIGKINEKYNQKIAEATQELEDYSGKYADVLKGLGVVKPVDPDDPEAIARQLKALRASLRSEEEILKEKEDLLTDNYNTQKEFINKNVADETERTNLITALEEKFNNDIKALKQQNIQDESSLLDNLRNSFKTKQELLTDNYNTHKDLITKNVADETERANDLTALEEKFNNDIKALKHQEFQEELAIAENKKQLGILSYEELKTTVDEYYEWAKANYAKDSKEYIQALNLMRNTNLRYGQELKKENEDLLNDTKETWETAVRLFDHNLIPFEQLQIAYKNYKQILQSTSSDANLTKDQINKITIAVKELDDQMQKVAQNQNWLSKWVNNTNDAFDEVNDQSWGVAGTVASNWANTFSRINREGFKFSRDMKALWKGLAYAIIDEINRIIAKWLVLMALKGISALFTRGASSALPLGTGEGLSSGGNFAADGGYISGPGGPKDDAIPVWLSNGEYVINAEKTSIFRGLLDYINFAPLSALKNNISIPSLNMPAIPKLNYASGGTVAHSGFDLSNIERKLDKLDKVIAELQELKKKDYSVQVNTKFRGVEFAKEVNKAQSQYKRIMG